MFTDLTSLHANNSFSDVVSVIISGGKIMMLTSPDPNTTRNREVHTHTHTHTQTDTHTHTHTSTDASCHTMNTKIQTHTV